jgi:hypothetical protein
MCPTYQPPPLFMIEIASLEEPSPVLRGTVTDHLAMGVSTVVIVDRIPGEQCSGPELERDWD